MLCWRLAQPEDDEAVVSMSMALYSHELPPEGVSAAQVRATLEMFRHEPVRGRALVADADGRLCGYALLVSFWSNELGGEICTIDELFIAPECRNRGLATLLVTALLSDDAIWPRRPVALELEVSPDNSRARALYERLGFRDKRNATMRLDNRPAERERA